MTTIHALIVILSFLNIANAISPGENYETTITLSPSRRQLIANDWCCYKDGDYVGEGTGIERSTLYSLPLSTAPGIPLIPGDYQWSEHGTYCIAEVWVRETPYNDLQAYQHRIWGYDPLGVKIDVPGYGVSPAFSFNEDTVIYSSEFSDEGDLVAPQLYEFNLKTKTRKLLATFPEIFTFWGSTVPPDPEVDHDTTPMPVKQMWAGHRGLIYKKKPEEEDYIYTFVVSWEGAKLTIWKGNYYNSISRPPDHAYLEEK